MHADILDGLQSLNYQIDDLMMVICELPGGNSYLFNTMQDSIKLGFLKDIVDMRKQVAFMCEQIMSKNLESMQ